MNDLKRLRAACKARLRDVEIPRPFDLDQFARNVQSHRNRPLFILPLQKPASDNSPYGTWWATKNGDFIFHEPETTELHRTQIVLHELAHMLLGHSAALVMDQGVSREGLPDIDPEIVESMMRDPQIVESLLHRHDYASPEEREAEMLGSLMLEEAGLARLSPAAPRDALSRLGDVLGHPRGKRGTR